MDMWLCKVVWFIGGGMLLWFIGGEAALTESQKEELLNRHNYFRSLEGASNMRYMTWSQTLADKAQNWATGCRFFHDSGSGYGENLWAHSSQTISDVTEAVDDWVSEKSEYDYQQIKCSVPPCGHYTQVVWAKTHQVGCGLEVCGTLEGFGSGTYIVCNYNPPGNYQGERPYSLGEPCTACDNGIYNCYDGMCRSDCSDVACECKACQACQNCATVTPDCSCQCSVGWSGTTCTDQCGDEQVGCSYFGLSDCDEDSDYYVDMVRDCYAYCGFCEAGDAATDCSLSGQEFCGTPAPTSGTETPSSGTARPPGGTETPASGTDTAVSSTDMSDNTNTTVASLWLGSCSPALALSTPLLPVLLSAYSILSH